MAKIILECCQNHNGDKEILKKMIHSAAESGADYCKMQSIRSQDLAKRERFENGLEENGVIKVIKRPYEAEKSRLSKLDLTLDDHKWFIDECQRAGIEPMTTIFNHAMVKPISELDFKTIKVASYDCANLPFLEHLSQHFNNLIISTGACYDEEIVKAAEGLKHIDTTFLHCVSIYPTPLNELHLSRMFWLNEVTNSAGFSDHTLVERDGLIAARAAIALGASHIERHFTVLPSDQTKDGVVSINPEQAKELAINAKQSPEELEDKLNKEIPNWKDIMLGESQRPLSHSELLNRDYYNGRFTSYTSEGQINNWEPWNQQDAIKV